MVVGRLRSLWRVMAYSIATWPISLQWTFSGGVMFAYISRHWGEAHTGGYYCKKTRKIQLVASC